MEARPGALPLDPARDRGPWTRVLGGALAYASAIGRTPRMWAMAYVRSARFSV